MKSRQIKAGNWEYSYYDEGLSDKALIFIHGVADSKDFGARFFKSFPGYRCIALDLPGHNGLDIQGVYEINDFVMYFKTFVECMNLKNVSIVGFSFGGIIATLYSNATENINKVVLWSVPFNGVYPFVIKGFKFTAFIDRVTSRNGKHNLKLLRKLLKMSRIELSLKEVGAYLSVDTKYVGDILSQISNVCPKGEIPTLVIGGTNEKVFNSNIKQRFANNENKNVIIKEVRNGGHFGTKAGWKQSINLIRGFINE